jgi:hypothetical protein
LEKVLKGFNMLGAKPLSTTVHKGNVLGKNLCPKDEEKMKFMERFPMPKQWATLSMS